MMKKNIKIVVAVYVGEITTKQTVIISRAALAGHLDYLNKQYRAAGVDVDFNLQEVERGLSKGRFTVDHCLGNIFMDAIFTPTNEPVIAWKK